MINQNNTEVYLHIVYTHSLVLFMSYRPYSSVLGQAKNTEIFRNMDNYEKVCSVVGWPYAEWTHLLDHH